MTPLQTIKMLLVWMEQNLNHKSEFSVADVSRFFADDFVIKTNSRNITATPETYREYLYKLKSTLNGVTYDLDEMFETQGKVVAPFVIHLNFSDKKPQKLLAISIFTFNKAQRIVEWKEVFTNADQQTFEYDPK